MKVRRPLIVLLVLTAFLFALVVSCGGKAADTGAAAQTQETIRWRLQSWAPAGDATYEAAEKFSKMVEAASGAGWL